MIARITVYMTRVLCYTEDINGRTIHRKVEIPQDVYKVRVINY